ncbi:hypothetical protein [Kitasatospora sp. NPDC004531]
MAGNDGGSAGAEHGAGRGPTRLGLWWTLACLPVAWQGGEEVLRAAFGYPAPCLDLPGSDFGNAFFVLLQLPTAFLLLVLAAGVGLLVADSGRSRWRFLLALLAVVLIHMIVRIQLLQGPPEFC